MTALRVTPAHRGGRDRLYVSLPDGRPVAWYDRGGGGAGRGRVSLVSEGRRDAVLEALAPYLVGDFTVGPPPVPTAVDLAGLTLHPDDDLAPNRPGELLRGELEHRGRGGRRRLLPDRRRGAFAQLAAERVVGEALDPLEGGGWRILHSVPLPGADRIDHLAIGVGGVLAIHTIAACGLRVRVAGGTVRAGRGEPVPLLRRTRWRAERAERVLGAEVRAALVVVGAARLEVAAVPREVLVVGEDARTGRTGFAALTGIAGLIRRLTPRHAPAAVHTLYVRARDRHTWLEA
ncbi:nuclease-related domain-containing protein [Streptomyces sp. NPDC057638]|uniref:nuclease-related domain-containing protein n=1 Tax=Streptomyces sp. NPDC057638 TaxID=3346190 RepID=UPI00369C5CBE